MINDCWEYDGSLNNRGYGQQAGRLVHRTVFAEWYGYLPDVVMHTCDNRRCYNPRHLRGGTQRDNVADAIAKGRFGKPTLNQGMPADNAAYQRERRARIAAGTWNYQ